MSFTRRSMLQAAAAAVVLRALSRVPYEPEVVGMTSTNKILADGEAVTVRYGPGTSTPASVNLATGDTYSISTASASLPPPPTGSDWFRHPFTPPVGAKTYTGSGSLGSFLNGLAAGSTGVIEWDGIHTEEITGLAVKDGVTVMSALAHKPVLDGVFKGGSGKAVKFFGVSVTDPNISSSEHMVDFNKGDGLEFAYAEISYAGCYTLLHPTGSLVNANFHHLYIHDNPGPHGTANQDHGFYCSRLGDSKSQIHHCLFQNFPHGRCVKLGAASGSTLITGFRIHHNTMIDGKGPSDLQFSHGAGGNVVENNVFIGSGASTCVTEYDGAQPGNIVKNCWGDKKVLTPTANIVDGGGNVVKTRTELMDFAKNAAAGMGHLAP